MKSILSTSIYKFYEKKSNFTNLLTFPSYYNERLDKVDLKNLEDQIALIKKRYNFPMKNSIVQELLVDKTLVPINNATRIFLPIFIPAITIKNGIQSIALCNITPLVKKVADDGEINIDPIKLYAILQAGHILLKCKECFANIQVNQEILTLGSSCYSAMFCKVLDKLYAINMNMKSSDRARFLTALFFLVNLMERDFNDNIYYLASKACSGQFTSIEMNNIVNSIKKEDFINLESFIEVLKDQVPQLRNLNLRTFLENFARMYGTSTIFALEFLPLFFFTIFNTAISANISYSFMLEQLLGNQVDKLFTAFSSCTNR